MNNLEDVILSYENDIKKVLPSEGGNKEIEIEFRFNEIDEKIFDSILQHLENVEKSNVEYSIDTFYEGSDLRFSQFEASSNEGFLIRKKKLLQIKDTEYDFRIGVATEERVPLDEKENLIPLSTRRKIRESFYPTKGVKVDTTIVNDKIFEIEVEINSLDFYKSFVKIIEELYLIIYSTERSISLSEKKEVTSYLLKILKESDTSKIFNQARNIKPKDLISGEVCYYYPGCCVAPKADGERRLLFSFPTKEKEKYFYLINFTRSGNVISKFSIDEKDSLSLNSEKNVTLVFDGEYISSKNLFLSFDCLYFNGDMRKENYLKRCEKLIEFTSKGGLKSRIKEKLIIFTENNNQKFINDSSDQRSTFLERESDQRFTTLLTKENSIQNFYDKVKEILLLPVEYLTDGLMFTPIGVNYSDLSTNFNKVGILKWKPESKLTIDFQLGDGKKLLSNFKGKLILFNAEGYSFSKNVNWDSIFSSGAKEGDIIEVYPSFEEGGDVSLTFSRFRNDKTAPNNINVAKDVYRDILSPLSLEDITGETLFLASKYHNRIKKELFLKRKEATPPDERYLIDIGSGKGGDLSKWDGFTKIFCIEPNEKNISEFKRRLSQKVKKRDAPPINLRIKEYSCCEDYFPIIKEIEKYFSFTKNSTLTISMMLSLSFFWEDNKKLKNLARFLKEIVTLFNKFSPKEEVHFIFLTIVGDSLRNLFKLRGNDIVLANARIKYSPQENNVNFHIENSIVNDQTEYFVELPQLTRLTGMESLFFKLADNEPFLSRDEKIFSDLYGYGEWKSTKSSIYLNEGETLPFVFDESSFLINGIKRDENKKRCISFYTNVSRFPNIENLSFEEIAILIKRDIYLIKNDELFLYPSDGDTSLIPIVLIEYPDGIYNPITEE